MINKESTHVMEPTLERMVPESADAKTFWEHVSRYQFARRFVPTKSVLDVACGEGYGTKSLMIAGAKSVIGVDLSVEACEHARLRYGVDARQGDATALPVPDASVQVIVSFETIEHVPNPSQFLDECIRVLTHDGVLIVSTPNTPVHSPKGRGINPFHVSEMDEREFCDVLSTKFGDVEMYSQSISAARFGTAQYWCAEQNLFRVGYRFYIERIWRRAAARLARWIGARAWSDNLFAMKPARRNALNEIAREPGILARLFDPALVRKYARQNHENPLYYVAVCRKRKGKLG